MQEAIPAIYFQEGRQDDFLIWLRALSIPPEDKKQLLLFWADKVRIKVSAEMITRAGIK